MGIKQEEIIKTLSKYTIGSLLALAMVLSLTYAQPAGAVLPRGENLAASTPPYLSNIQAIDLGGFHTCALTTSGGVKCWGDNSDGQLGYNTIAEIERGLIPADVIGLTSGANAISAGGAHTCALTSGGGVKCWGDNENGQLGDGTTISRHSPVSVIGLSSGAIAISTGWVHTCALTSGGGVKCWGRNLEGQLGDGTTTRQLTPVDVIGLTSGVIAISSGYTHTCALTSEGGVTCWGNNESGQLGDNTRITRLTPVDVIGLSSGIIAISTGEWHTCALVSGGGVKCWGRNHKGQLGDGTTTTRLTPTDVVGLTSAVKSITVGDWHTCAVTIDGGGKCWGWNNYGQLGDGTRILRLTPVDVFGLTDGITAISAGYSHTCAQTSGGGVKCWGYNIGQLGDGTLINRNTPTGVIVLNGRIFRSIGTQDGYIWESTETSGIGLKANTTDTTFLVGDDKSDRQYRAILSFNTSILPDTAVIFSASIQLFYAGQQGYPDFSPIKIDIRKPFFGSSILLLPSDFQSAPSKAFVGTCPHYYSTLYCNLGGSALQYINLAGSTQFRVRQEIDDNDNMRTDYYRIYSGDAQTNNRPQLIIYYYVP